MQKLLCGRRQLILKLLILKKYKKGNYCLRGKNALVDIKAYLFRQCGDWRINRLVD